MAKLGLTFVFANFLSAFVASSRETVFMKLLDDSLVDEDAFVFDCVRKCSESVHCQGISALPTTNRCDNLDSNQMKNVSGLKGYFYKKIVSSCKNGGQRADEFGTSCVCPGSFTGTYCGRYWNDCSEGLQLGQTTSGLYTIQPRLSPTSFQVYCKMKGGGRTYIQKQKSGINFYRSWQEYRDGFGSPGGDHWLGLDKIKAITDTRKHSLMIHLKYECCPSGRQGFFHEFKITDEDDGYRMTFSHFKTNAENEIPDALTELKGARFSTYDKDNDDNPDGSCAQTHHSGWWFKNCTSCNPNGRLKPIPVNLTGDPTEMFWAGDPRGVTEMYMILK